MAEQQCGCGSHKKSEILKATMNGSLSSAEEYAEISQAQKSGQSPKILAIKCCDSRSLFEALMGKSQVGHIFQLTSLGACFEPVKGQAGYPLRHFDSIEMVVIMGHGDCGAGKAITFGHNEPDETGEHLDILANACESIQILPEFDSWGALQANIFRMCIGNVIKTRKFVEELGLDLPVIGCIDDIMNSFNMGNMVHYVTINGETDIELLKQHPMLANASSKQLALWTTWRNQAD